MLSVYLSIEHGHIRPHMEDPFFHWAYNLPQYLRDQLIAGLPEDNDPDCVTSDADFLFSIINVYSLAQGTPGEWSGTEEELGGLVQNAAMSARVADMVHRGVLEVVPDVEELSFRKTALFDQELEKVVDEDPELAFLLRVKKMLAAANDELDVEGA